MSKSVRVELARVINLGDYETLKIGFSIEDSSRVINGVEESVDQTFNRIFDYAIAKLDEKVTEAGG